MKHMTRTYKKEDAMLRPEHQSTLEKNQAKRNKPKSRELAEDGLLNSKVNQRMKRKEALHDAMNKLHDPDIA